MSPNTLLQARTERRTPQLLGVVRSEWRGAAGRKVSVGAMTMGQRSLKAS